MTFFSFLNISFTFQISYSDAILFVKIIMFFFTHIVETVGCLRWRLCSPLSPKTLARLHIPYFPAGGCGHVTKVGVTKFSSRERFAEVLHATLGPRKPEGRSYGGTSTLSSPS